MKEGLLWFDNDPRRSLDEKIAQAAERYTQKFGRQPNTCYVNPEMVLGTGKRKAINKVRVVTAQNILLYHFWLGIARSDHVDCQRRTP